VLPTQGGWALLIRKGSTPEKPQREIYDILSLSGEVMKPVKTWDVL